MIKGWYYKEFKQYVQRHGLKLLYDDYKYIERTITEWPEFKQREAMRGYVKEWQAAPTQNEGRRRANQWLMGLLSHVIDGVSNGIILKLDS